MRKLLCSKSSLGLSVSACVALFALSFIPALAIAEEDPFDSIRKAAAAAASRGPEMAPNKATMQNKSVEFGEAFGLAHPQLANTPNARGKIQDGASMSFSQSNKYKVNLWMSMPTEVCLPREQCYDISRNPVSFQLSGANVKITNNGHLEVELCDKGMSGGFCKEEDWTSPQAIPAGGSLTLSGQPLMVDDNGAPRTSWSFSVTCEESGLCELLVGSEYRHGGTPVAPLGPNNPNTEGKNRFASHPAAQLARKIYEPSPDDDNYNPEWNYKFLGGGRDENNMFVNDGKLAENQDCHKERLAAIEAGGDITVNVRCEDGGSQLTFNTGEVQKNAIEIAVPEDDDPEAFAAVAASSSIIEQVGTYADIDQATGKIEIFKGESTYCKRVNGGFREWARIGGLASILVRMAINDPEELNCCSDDPNDIDTGANFGHCKQHEKDLASARMSGSAYYIKGADTVSDKSVCLYATPPASHPEIALAHAPLIGDNAQNVSGLPATLAWYAERFGTPKICGGGTYSLKAAAAWLMLSPGRDLHAESVLLAPEFIPSTQERMYKKQYYCSFPSMMARIFHEQGRPQINRLATTEAAGAITKELKFPFYGVERTEYREGGVIEGDYSIVQGPDQSSDIEIGEVVDPEDPRNMKTEFVEAVSVPLKTSTVQVKFPGNDHDLNHWKPHCHVDVTLDVAGGSVRYPDGMVMYNSNTKKWEIDKDFVVVKEPSKGVLSVGKGWFKYEYTVPLLSGDDLTNHKNVLDAFAEDKETDRLPEGIKKEPKRRIVETYSITSCFRPKTITLTKEGVVTEDAYYKVIEVPPEEGEKLPEIGTPGEIIVDQSGSTTIAGGTHHISARAGWLPEWVVNGNRMTFWQWDGRCSPEEAESNKELIGESLFAQNGMCPLADKVYMAVCDTADCGELPENPFDTTGNKWSVHLLDAEPSSEVSALNRYVLSQGGCDIQENECVYRVSALPRGAGGQLHLTLPISWNLYSYDAPSGGGWDYDNTISGNQIHFQTWVNPVATESPDIRLRFCIGLSSQCLPGEGGGWSSVESNWIEKTIPASLELEGVQLNDTPELWLRGGECSLHSCDYTADLFLKVEAMPWVEKPMTYDTKKYIYRRKRSAGGITVVSEGSVNVPHTRRSHPNCAGFSLDQFMALDMSQIDLSEYIETVTGEALEKLDDFFK